MKIDEAEQEAKDYIEFMETAGDNADWTKTLLKENFEMKTKLEKIQILNLYIGSQDYDNEDNIIIDYEPFNLELLEED